MDPARASFPPPWATPNSGDAVKVFVDANIAVAPDDTNEVGEPHTFTVTVMKNDGSGGFVAAAGEHVDFTLTADNGAIIDLDEVASTCDDLGPNTDGSGQCIIVFTSDSAGTITAHASVDLFVLGVELSRQTDGTHGSSGDAVKRFVDAFIRIGPSGANEVGEPHTFTVTVMQDDGSDAGFVPATVGHVEFTLSDENGAVSVLNSASSTCDDAGDNLDDAGNCTIVFTSESAGNVTGHANITLSVAGVDLFRETD